MGKSILPFEVSCCLIFCDFCFKEVFFFAEIHNLTHPWKWIFITKEDREIDHLTASVNDMTDILFHRITIESENSVRKTIIHVCELSFCCLFEEVDDFCFEFFCPYFWILSNDTIDEITTVGDMD